MTFCQAFLKAQFAVKEGLNCTLVQEKEKERKVKKGLQVIHIGYLLRAIFRFMSTYL